MGKKNHTRPPQKAGGRARRKSNSEVKAKIETVEGECLYGAGRWGERLYVGTLHRDLSPPGEVWEAGTMVLNSMNLTLIRRA